MTDIQLVQINQERRQDFIVAWEAAFSRQLDKSIYDWIFDGVNVLYAALIDGEIAAGYCLYPLKCVLQKKPAVALLCNNVFVHPSHQGKHLFTKLGKLALQDAGNRGYGHIAFGIPNRQALPGHKRVGWGVQPTIKFLEKTRGEPKNRDVVWTQGQLNELQRRQIQACSERSAQNRDFSIIKTAEFVRWRYESKPGNAYWFGFVYDNDELMAYCVCKYYEPSKTLHVLDIDGSGNRFITRLIEQLTSVTESFDKLNVWGTTAHASLFIEAGFKEAELEDNLIFIIPGDLQAIYFDGNINVCLADNDVY